MNDNRRVFLFACAISCACSAHQPLLHDAGAEQTTSVSFEPPAPQTDVVPASVAAQNPYAPTRLSLLNSYAWQNPKRPTCSAPLGTPRREETYTTQVRLSFSGSVAAFPLLPEDDPSAPKPEVVPSTPALEPVGTGSPPPGSAGVRRDPDFVVASLRPRLRGCFAGLLERRAQAEGSIRFALELGCAGEVQTISAKAEGVDEPTVECLFAVVAPALFDPPVGGRATIHMPVVFKNSAR
jgi:hypothetical protein